MSTETKSTENVAVFFDVQNLYHSSKNISGNKISYRSLLEKIGEGRNIIQAKAYSGHRNGGDCKSSNNFYKALTSLGIQVVTKKVQAVKNEKTHDVKIVPVHFDVEMTTDALLLPEDTTTVALCTGNGNFNYLVQALKDEVDVNVEIWSFKVSTSDSLMKTADRFVEIPEECFLSNGVKEEVVTPAKV